LDITSQQIAWCVVYRVSRRVVCRVSPAPTSSARGGTQGWPVASIASGARAAQSRR
jgi:hypothetical protein